MPPGKEYGIPDLEDEEDNDNPYMSMKAGQGGEGGDGDDDDGGGGLSTKQGGGGGGGGGGDDDEWGGREKKKTDEDEEWIDPDGDIDGEAGWGDQSKPKAKPKPKTSDPSERPFANDDEEEEDLEMQFKTFGKKEANEIAEERQMEKMVQSAADKVAEERQKQQMDREAERLGEDFEDTPWVPPSIQKAMDFRAHSIFRAGVAPIGHVDVCSASDLSLGCVLHFQFMKSMAVMSFVMFLLSIPSLVFAYAGSRISTVDQDSLGLYRFTLGNLGYDPSSPTYIKDSHCSSMPKDYNGTCIHFQGLAELTLVNAGSILTATEFLQCFVFFCTLWHLSRKTHSLKKLFERIESTVSNYAIFVDHLPSDTTVEQLIAHFTNLYPLDTTDWLGRPPVVGAVKVQACENTGLPVHLNTWVAECTLFKRVGKLIRRFKKMTRLTEQLRALRARIKMYSDDTPHYRGPQPRKRLDTVDKYIMVGHKVDTVASKLRKRHFRTVDLDLELANNERLPFMERISAPAVAAFVVFQYTESMARCIEDYEKYSAFPRSIFFPDRLKFRGHRIKVRQAPQPDSIVWENLEVPRWQKRLKRARTLVLVIVLVLVAFAIDLQATKLKNDLSNSTPSVTACRNQIPELYAQGNSTGAHPITSSMLSDIHIHRASKVNQPHMDALCHAAAGQDTFYATYSLTRGGAARTPYAGVGQYSFSACSKDAAAAAGLPYWGLCPHTGQTVFCPCASLTSTEDCQSVACTASPSSASCSHFPASSMGSCLCVDELAVKVAEITSSGSDALNQIRALESDLCGAFYLSYSSSLALIYVSALTSVVISVLLASAMTALAHHENHNSLDATEGSKMSKLFYAQYVTLCVIILIAYGRIEGLPALVRETIGIFNGPYKDFTAAWYGNVGNFLVITFLLRFVYQYAYDFYQLYFSLSVTRILNQTSIESHRNTRYVTQDEVNHLYVGPKFDVSTRTAATLVTVFYMMTFAPGLPVLVPLTCIILVLEFRLQKRLLLRHEAKPDHMDAKIMISVINLLPFAAIIRLGLAAWMYGNPIMFESPGMAAAVMWKPAAVTMGLATRAREAEGVSATEGP